MKDVLYWEERRVVVDESGRTEIEYVQPRNYLWWPGPARTKEERLERVLEMIRKQFVKDAVKNG
jgi:hypothetical protein